MEYWTVINAREEFSNAWETYAGVALRAHNGPSVLQTDCDTVEKALKKHVGQVFHPHRMEISNLQPGEFYPRIHRQAFRSTQQEFPLPHIQFGTEMAASLESARTLFVQARDVFRYVEPCRSNRSVYGDQLRSLLILACTEVESAWRSVLISNNGASQNDRLTTQQYVKLLQPMRLNEWEIGLSGFPDYPAQLPFGSWDRSAPTASLAWYDAYNRVKHDREGSLSWATLEHVLSAVCSVLVMLLAQFSLVPLRGPNPLSADFVLISAPSWRLGELYVPELVDWGNGTWRERTFF